MRPGTQEVWLDLLRHPLQDTVGLLGFGVQTSPLVVDVVPAGPFFFFSSPIAEWSGDPMTDSICAVLLLVAS